MVQTSTSQVLDSNLAKLIEYSWWSWSQILRLLHVEIWQRLWSTWILEPWFRLQGWFELDLAYIFMSPYAHIYIYIYIYPWMTSSNIILVLDTSKNLSPRLSMWPGWQSSGTLQLEAREFGASSGIPQRTNPAGKLCASISFQAVRSGIQTIPRFIWSGCLIQRFVQQRCKYGTVPRLRVTTIYIFYEIRKKYYRNWSQCPRNPYLWGSLWCS